ncbi:hypothetical protein Y032_0034g2852 [Ancylostoma ceylanicum]|uniref:Uncharacterized protein n=1 Tax=Ancylostoma ceylanicum TaxID=53326 RepID=A0A016ULY8_9BILA|nr:hypothetical protein Y032_0034g2852 [Ancylostoma ceylanicum]
MYNLITALSRYLLAADSSWPMMMFGYLLVSVGNLIYCYSFSSQIRLWSTELTIAVSIYLVLLFYYCFADLLMSIPSLVLVLLAALASSCVTIVGAGSVCLYGHVGDYDADQVCEIAVVFPQFPPIPRIPRSGVLYPPCGSDLPDSGQLPVCVEFIRGKDGDIANDIEMFLLFRTSASISRK